MVGGRTCWVRFGKSPAAAEAVCGARGGCLGRSTRAFAPFIYRVNGDAGGETCSLAPAPKVATLQSRRRTLAWASARDVEDGRDVDGCRASTTTQWFWRGLRPSRANRFRHQNAPRLGTYRLGGKISPRVSRRLSQGPAQTLLLQYLTSTPVKAIQAVTTSNCHPKRPYRPIRSRSNAAAKMRPRKCGQETMTPPPKDCPGIGRLSVECGGWPVQEKPLPISRFGKGCWRLLGPAAGTPQAHIGKPVAGVSLR